MKRILIVLLWLPVFSFAQKNKEKVTMHWISSAGTVSGTTGVRPLFQLSGGVVYHNYFSGIGIAYDRYKFSSIPVFADWRFHFGEKKVMFVYVNSGYNFPTGYHKEVEYAKTSDKMKGGFYMDAGFGYSIAVGKMHHLSLSTGYSRKSMTRKRIYTYPGTGETTNEYDYQYDFGRVVTKLSWDIGR